MIESAIERCLVREVTRRGGREENKNEEVKRLVDRKEEKK